MILDGKRLSESERLRMLADEEHASLEEMFYEYHSNAVQSVSLVPVEPAPTIGESSQTKITELDAYHEPGRSVEPGTAEAVLGIINFRVRQAT